MAVAVIGLLAAGGAAFTNSIGSFGGSHDQIGYASDTVSGATATGLQYVLSNDNSTITSVKITLQGDYTTSSATHPNDVFIGMFNNDNTNKVTCSPAASTSGGNTLVTCDYSSSPFSTSSATSFSLAVTTPGLTNNG